LANKNQVNQVIETMINHKSVRKNTDQKPNDEIIH